MDNFAHSGIFFVVVVRAIIVLGTKPGTLHSIHFAGFGTFSTSMILIKRNKRRWLIDSTGNCSVGKTCRLECLTLVTFHDQHPNIQNYQALENLRIHGLRLFLSQIVNVNSKMQQLTDL